MGPLSYTLICIGFWSAMVSYNLYLAIHIVCHNVVGQVLWDFLSFSHSSSLLSQWGRKLLCKLQLRNGEYLLLQKLYPSRLLVISPGVNEEMFRILEQPLRVKSPATDLDIFKAFAPCTVQIKTLLNFKKINDSSRFLYGLEAVCLSFMSFSL